MNKSAGNFLRVFAWLLTAALVAFVLLTTDFEVFGRSLRNADIVSFLTLALAFNVGHLVLDSIGVGVLLDRTGVGIPIGRLIPIRAASYLLGFVNYNLGLVVIAAAAGKGRGVRWQSLVSPFLALNVFDLAVLGTMLLAGLMAGGLPEAPAAFWPMVAGGAVSALALVVILIVSWSRFGGSKGFTAGFLDTFRALDGKTVVIVLLLRSVLLLTDAGGDLLMLRTFNLDIPVEVFARFFPVDSFACVLPVTIAGIGPTMVLMRLFFAPLSPAAAGGVSAVDAFSVSATTSLVLIRTVLALACMPVISSLFRKNRGKADGSGKSTG